MNASATDPLNHLELLAEVDALVHDIRAWSHGAPDWAPARICQALVERLLERTDALRIRIDAPLVVATLGGTGAGKSTLVNALVGANVTEAGHLRPTTRLPVLITRPDIAPAMLGIAEGEVRHVKCETPALRDLVLLDCPDPDTTEDPQESGSNLDRLRQLLPHCDVLLVTTTQQKYRSQRVASELAAAAPGARLVFVQTHAERDDDIRADWARNLGQEYNVGEMFFVDSVQALAEAQSGRAPSGDFARLLDLLSRQLARSAQHRIRRANFLDLVEQGLTLCQKRLEGGTEKLQPLEQAIQDHRAQIANRLSVEMRDRLLDRSREWEQRLLAEAVSRFGASPFAWVLRAYQGLGALVATAAWMRVRSLSQAAVVGTIQGMQSLKRRREDQAAELLRTSLLQVDPAELNSALIVLQGYAREAGLPAADLRPKAVETQASKAVATFSQRLEGEIDGLIRTLAARRTRWWTRLTYELLLLGIGGSILFRLGKNFFWDSWLAPAWGWTAVPEEVFGTDFLIQSCFWLVAWCVVLVLMFSRRLRRGLHRALFQLAAHWNAPAATGELFRGVEQQCRAARRFSQDLDHLVLQVSTAQAKIALPENLGSRLRAVG